MKMLRSKWVLSLLTLACFLGCYLGSNYINSLRGVYFEISLPFEKEIPFVPGFIFAYILLYFAIGALYFLIDDAIFASVISGFIFLTLVHSVIFVLFPVKMLMRPDNLGSGVSNWLVHLCYLVDKPYNCFPSLHVSYPLFAALILLSSRRTFGYIYLVVSIVIGISVVLVKQHYILDVFGSILVTLAIYLAFRRKFRVA
jgi:membrane-associated phospholipid phosphatase